MNAAMRGLLAGSALCASPLMLAATCPSPALLVAPMPRSMARTGQGRLLTCRAAM